MKKIDIRTVNVVQYKQPLREGGSLPAIVKADDEFNYVIKFKGAGQGKKALIAELIGAELARAIGLNVPELVFMNLDASFSKTEADEEIQDLLDFSVGLNLGLHFLSGAITYDPLVPGIDFMTASKIVLLDSMISNIDRTARNTNLLNWNREVWLIDHGAALYFHHNWDSWKDHLDRSFPLVTKHVLLGVAYHLKEAADEIKSVLSIGKINEIVSIIPEDWLIEEGDSMSASEKRQAYEEFLVSRLNKINTLVNEAEDAR